MPTDVEAVDIILGGIQGPPGPTGPPGPPVDPSTILVVQEVNTTGGLTVGESLDVVGDITLGGNLVAGQNVRANVAFYEYGRTVAMGYWQNEPFNALNYTATNNLQQPVGLWTLTAPDQLVLRWTIIGKTMLVAWNLTATSVTSTPNLLRIKIPGGHTAHGLATGTGSNQYNQNGVPDTGVAIVIPSSGYILLQQFPEDSTWSVSTNATTSRGSIAFEVQ